MKTIFAYFTGSPGGKLDNQAHAIFKRHKGKFCGSGTFLDTNQRDVQYDVAEQNVKPCVEALKKNGFQVEVQDIGAIRFPK
jgi:hypothetical protein